MSAGYLSRAHSEIIRFIKNGEGEVRVSLRSDSIY